MNKTRTITLLLCLVMLAVLLPGCHRGGMPHYDSRLEHADSVLRSNDPDSALRLLSAIDARALESAGDRAYHALLLTQAQYRCYVDITSDSTINVALDYYRHHENEQEKLTRSYIYKGAVTEVMGDPENAMACYKQAVDVAGSSDHYNLGYARMRIGCLYRDHLISDSSDITSLKQALRHFEQMPDSLYILNCLSTIGSCYVSINDDSAIMYLERADSLAKVAGNKYVEATNRRYIANLKMFSQDPNKIAQAKNIALAMLADADCPLDQQVDFHLIAAFTLAKLNKADSARLYLNRVDKDRLNDGLRVLYNSCYAELERCQGDINQYQYYYHRADDISDSLLSNNMQRQLRDVESKYDNEVLKNKSLSYRHRWMVSLLAAALMGCLLLAAVVAMRRRLAQRQRMLHESEDAVERLRGETARLTEQLNAHQAMSAELKQAICHHVEMFSSLVEQHVTNLAYSPKKFSEAFERAYSKNRPDDSFWTGFRSYANEKYNGIIAQTHEAYPMLSDTDLNFLSLYCCGFSTSVIMACMGFKEAHSAYNKKRRVAEALGFPANLDAYIALFRDSSEG